MNHFRKNDNINAIEGIMTTPRGAIKCKPSLLR